MAMNLCTMYYFGTKLMENILGVEMDNKLRHFGAWRTLNKNTYIKSKKKGRD
jgi:hypothetical protein